MLPISLVILSYNRLEELSNNIPLLLSSFSSKDEIQVIIVDNCSNDGSKEYLYNLQKKFPSIILVLNERNLGVGEGRNSGFRKAEREFIVSLDDDSSIQFDDLLKIPSIFERNPDAGILAFQVVKKTTNEPQNLCYKRQCEVAHHHGAGFAFRRSILDFVGGIDASCDFGGEELDFAIKVRAQGWKIIFIPEIIISHNNIYASGNLAKHRRIRRTYNNIRIFYKYFPRWMAFRNSCRYVIIMIINWLRNFGPGGLNKVIASALNGRKSGIIDHQYIPQNTVRFYNNSKLMPEFGNIPLAIKLKRKLTIKEISEFRDN